MATTTQQSIGIHWAQLKCCPTPRATNQLPDLSWKVDTRWRTTQQPGARFAPAAFVTGSLDPVQNRDNFLAWFQPLSAPVLVVIGEQTPPKSRAEMDALTTLPGVQTQILPGSLGLHEEYSVALAEAILPFLQSTLD